jgi:hypothetical protein
MGQDEQDFFRMNRMKAWAWLGVVVMRGAGRD